MRPFDFAKLFGSIIWLVAAALGGAISYRWVTQANGKESKEVVEGWRSYIDEARALEGDSADVPIVVFTDYQCPFCKSLDDQLEQIRASGKAQFRVILRHFPLERIHPMAREFANAIECTESRVERTRLHRYLFSTQDRNSPVSWGEIGKELHLQDHLRFEHCIRERLRDSLVAHDVSLAKQLGLRGTPAMIISGEVYRGVGEASMLANALREASKIESERRSR